MRHRGPWHTGAEDLASQGLLTLQRKRSGKGLGGWVVAVCVTVRERASGELRERGGCLGAAGTLRSSQAVLTPGGGGGPGGLGGGGVCNGA